MAIPCSQLVHATILRTCTVKSHQHCETLVVMYTGPLWIGLSVEWPLTASQPQDIKGMCTSNLQELQTC